MKYLLEKTKTFLLEKVNNIKIYLDKLPQFNYVIGICRPYFMYMSCNALFYYGKLQIFYQKISPNEKEYEYLSLYCIDNNDFIDW